MDLTETIVPSSDQLNADDLISGPITVTIAGVRGGNAEQPVQIDLTDIDRPYRPCLTVRRILVAAWGIDTDPYTGRRMTLYRDETVRWAGQPIGGIRVSHLSHIERQLQLALTTARGKRAMVTIDPIPETADIACLPGEQSQQLLALMERKGIRAHQRVAGVAHLLGRPVQDIARITPDELRLVLDDLGRLPDAQEAP